jgi:hypothetical protein
MDSVCEKCLFYICYITYFRTKLPPARQKEKSSCARFEEGGGKGEFGNVTGWERRRKE